MRNIKLTIEYDGSRYDGWQKQAGRTNRLTIQEKIETVLSKMENESIQLVGAVRTESGVHAYAQTANFKTKSKMKPYEIKHYLNRYLPRDIAVVEAEDVPLRFHSTFSVESAVYQYKIVMGEVASVFERKYSYYSFRPLDIDAMRQGAKILIGKHDLKAFSDNPRMKKSTVREIYNIDIYGDKEEILITIHADDFWPGLARILVGTLLEIGQGNRRPEDLTTVIASGDRRKAGEAAEPQGLFLQEIRYKQTEE
ncbi:tRNA pseudouridine(38-40) synthase TruA [Anaerolentibacter hominis]|uniref:tRNA pseudouridine(38-40) synthase TruA n=1 Tax=Anaerolentibacter hominis TaxID=3079009 RepID=UPI0031B860D0